MTKNVRVMLHFKEISFWSSIWGWRRGGRKSTTAVPNFPPVTLYSLDGWPPDDGFHEQILKRFPKMRDRRSSEEKPFLSLLKMPLRIR
ncbi:hypothetical protein AVEN_81710-1 [Araneus ventricosus]|uniref:Uncharacterized protein n=1 Tax=Araneus ventricosus TaxID=182803 RepID=A0A4Y2IB21_ARAVE|nr:hypothetical protein AVEN_81710-1 [Araneus ventricosus]